MAEEWMYETPEMRTHRLIQPHEQEEGAGPPAPVSRDERRPPLTPAAPEEKSND